MTLVIAGHDIEKTTSRPGYSGTNHGLFVVADSTITDGHQTLLSGFKKIYTVPIKVYKPYFVDGHFREYLTPGLESNCFIAFAGSTITAQHVLNSINNHMSVLRYGYEGSGVGIPGTYQVLTHCLKNSLFDGGKVWDEDMFLYSNLKGLLTGDVVCNVVLHSIQGALASAKRHKIDKRGWDSLLTQYVLGTYCEKQQRNRLFAFIPSLKKDALDVIVDVVVDVMEIPPGELVVLGMENFGDRAREEYQRAYEAKDDVKSAMFAFLNMAIDEVQSNGDLQIDRPSMLKAFSRGELTELDRK
jgi:hypothetical protein